MNEETDIKENQDYTAQQEGPPQEEPPYPEEEEEPTFSLAEWWGVHWSKALNVILLIALCVVMIVAYKANNNMVDAYNIVVGAYNELAAKCSVLL